MAEAGEKDPEKEGIRIARAYLSRIGWTKEWRRYFTTQVSERFSRDELEDKNLKADAMEEEAEAELSTAFEELRKRDDSGSKTTLAAILKILGPRNDLGIVGKSIVNRIRAMIKPF
jgi:hypothetical protein